jgi:PAS domain S-box-containing protein
MTLQAPPAPIRLFLEGDERYRLLVESIGDYAIYMLDATGHVLTWNAGAQRIKGYTADQIVGRHFSAFHPVDAAQRGYPEHELSVAASVGRFEDEGWRVRRDGSLFWAHVVVTALRDDSGSLCGFGKVTRDLTQQREHQESLRRSEERFRLLVDGVDDHAIFMLDPNGYVMTWNSGAERINGYLAAEIIGQHFSRFYPSDAVASGWPEHELQVATTTGRFEEEGWRLRKDGAQYWANVAITALRDDNGRLLGFAKLTRDLSERRRSQLLEADGAHREAMLEAERTARIEAQRVARIKDEFLATLSHELRTPLNAILGWTQILRGPHAETGADLTHALEVIERNARAQIRLVDDLLDLNRIMAGRIRLDVQRVVLEDIVRGALESARPAADSKGLRLDHDFGVDDNVVWGDAGRLQQVIWNLLSNAIKFTPKSGQVRVSVEPLASHVRVCVSDTGIGIPPHFLPHVFDRFSQKDSTASRGYSGLGLGLAISKQLVELHGGTIEARSAGEEQGATFVVLLPKSAPPSERDDRAPVPPNRASAVDAVILPTLDRVRALVVDDELDARELVARVLESQGARVTLAGSAEEALRILAVSTPDVLISDVGMPETDGYQLIRQLRASEPKGRRLPALALTAFARAEDRKRVMLAGYQAHLAKPFDVAELVLIVADLAERG